MKISNLEPFLPLLYLVTIKPKGELSRNSNTDVATLQAKNSKSKRSFHIDGNVCNYALAAGSVGSCITMHRTSMLSLGGASMGVSGRSKAACAQTSQALALG